MEFSEDILAGETHYAGECDDKLLAQMAAGHVDQLSATLDRQPRRAIRVPIVEAGEDEVPEYCCQPSCDATDSSHEFATQTTRLDSQAVPPAGDPEIAAEREALLGEPEVAVDSDDRPELPELMELPVKCVVAEQPGESGAVSSITAQLCWVLGGCGVSGALCWLLLA